MSCFCQVSRQNVSPERAIRISIQLELSTAVEVPYSVHTEPWKLQNDWLAAVLTKIIVPCAEHWPKPKMSDMSCRQFLPWLIDDEPSEFRIILQSLYSYSGIVIVRVMQFFRCLSLSTHAASLKKQFVQSICSWSATETPGSDTSNLHSHFPPVFCSLKSLLHSNVWLNWTQKHDELCPGPHRWLHWQAHAEIK